jgi:hypothetical protein
MGIEHLLGSYYRQKNEFLTTDLLQNGQNDHDDCQQTHFCMVLPADKIFYTLWRRWEYPLAWQESFVLGARNV